MSEIVNLRIIKANNTVYIKVDSVINILRLFAESEETDTRERINKLADSIGRKSKEVMSL